MPLSAPIPFSSPSVLAAVTLLMVVIVTEDTNINPNYKMYDQANSSALK